MTIKEWICVENGTPENEKAVLLCISKNDTYIYVVGEYTEFGWFVPEYETYDVIAWMEIPEFPVRSGD